MSAGGLSYSALQTNRRVTLPSVEMWSTNMNILQDPPKSVYTRRIDKVGDTQNTLMETDASGDRACEYIRVYARGVNPMVSVSYDNFSNNGGQNTVGKGSDISFYQNRQVRYPYRVETLRPPMLRQEDLLPLSRLPRVWYHAETNPQFPEFRQQHSCSEQSSSTVESPLRVGGDVGGALIGGPTKDRTGDGMYTHHATHEEALRATWADEGFRPMGQEKEARGSIDPSSGVQTDRLHAMAETHRSASTIQRQGERGEAGTMREIDRNRRVYEAFSNRTTGGSGPTVADDACDAGLTQKSINPNLMYIQAQTNNRGLRQGAGPDAPDNPILQASKTVAVMDVTASSSREGWAAGLADRADATVSESAVLPTKSMLYRSVETPRQSTARHGEMDDPQTPRHGLVEMPVHIPVASQKGLPQGRIEVDATARAQGSTHDSIAHIRHDGRIQFSDGLEGGYYQNLVNRPGSVHTSVIHPELPGRAVFSAYDRPDKPDRDLSTIPTADRLRGAAHANASLPGQASPHPTDSPLFQSRSLDRVLPRYTSRTGVQGIENEPERSDLRHLDRRSVLVQNAGTIPAENLPLYSDMYADGGQSRTPRQGRQRLPMESFLHNHSALPALNDGSHPVPVTDQRVALRRKAFDTFMERTFVPPPFETPVHG